MRTDAKKRTPLSAFLLASFLAISIFRRARIDPLLNDVQLFRRQIGKVLTSALHLNQKAVRRLARNNDGAVGTTLHQTRIGQHVKPAGRQITVTARALRCQEWAHIRVKGWRAI